MALSKNKKINLAIIALSAVSFVIVLLYLNLNFDLAFKIKSWYRLYEITKLSNDIQKKFGNINGANTNNAETESKLQVQTTNNPIKGSPQAKVAIIEFSDFSCAACAGMNDSLKQAEIYYDDEIKIIWKDFPLASIHPLSEKAAEAARCAGEQGNFWTYHDLLFINQNKFSLDLFGSLAKQLNLKNEQFNSCLESGKMAALIDKDITEGNTLKVDGTPYLFINNTRVPNALSFNELKQIIDKELPK
jgi:protein-disulfide isomerase